MKEICPKCKNKVEEKKSVINGKTIYYCFKCKKYWKIRKYYFGEDVREKEIERISRLNFEDLND